MPAFKKYKLGELASEEKGAVKSGPFGSNIGSRFFVECGVPVIRGNNLTIGNEKFKDEGFVFLTEEKAAELNCWAVKDDLLFTAAGTIGQVGILTGQEKYERYVISNKQIKVSLNKKLIYPLYAYYWFSSPEIIEYIKNNNTGSTIPLINLSVVKSLPIELPEFPTQTRIASILSSLDDKIELNRRMNQTLEQMAQALFNHYFVDNIDPDNLPEGWKMGKLNEEFEIIMGQSPEGSSYNQDRKGIPFFQGRTDFNFRFPSFRIYTTSPKRFAKKFDVLISVRAPVGDLNVALTDCCIGRGIGAIRNKMGCTSYTYYKLKSLTEIFKPYNGEGTVFGSINKEELGNVSILIPSKEKVMAFEELVRPMDLKIYGMQKETENLSKIRDTLLPKLMSGEIEVDKVMNEEQIIETDLADCKTA